MYVSRIDSYPINMPKMLIITLTYIILNKKPTHLTQGKPLTQNYVSQSFKFKFIFKKMSDQFKKKIRIR